MPRFAWEESNLQPPSLLRIARTFVSTMCIAGVYLSVKLFQREVF